jgi:hypothetical protein
MVPVALAMIGSGLGRPSVLFLGWFGPRGPASIIFAGLVIEDADLPGAGVIITVVMITVGLSVLAHGATSRFGSEAYADWYSRTSEADPETHAGPTEPGGGFRNLRRLSPPRPTPPRPVHLGPPPHLRLVSGQHERHVPLSEPRNGFGCVELMTYGPAVGDEKKHEDHWLQLA